MDLDSFVGHYVMVDCINEGKNCYEHGQHGVGLQFLPEIEERGLAIQRHRRRGRNARIRHWTFLRQLSKQTWEKSQTLS